MHFIKGLREIIHKMACSEQEDDTGNNYLHELLKDADCVDESELLYDLNEYFLQTPKDAVLFAVNKQNIFGSTPLLEYLLSMEPCKNVVELLIRFGSDINITGNLHMGPLYQIVVLQNIPSRYLQGQYLGQGERNIIDYQNENEKEIMELLLKSGANANKVDIFGRPPLFIINDLVVIRKLLEYGTDLNTTDKCGRTIILAALTMPNFDYLMRFYISKVPQHVCHKPDKYGSTPLHYAAILRKTDMFEELVRKGANPQVTDNYGYTPEAIRLIRSPPCTTLYERQDNRIKKIGLRKVDFVRYTDIMQSTNVSEFVHQPRNSSELWEVLNQPGLGAAWDENESKIIRKDIVDLATFICQRIGQLDSRLKCSLFRSGSSAEGTKVGDPNEFDFVFCLNEFPGLCKVVEVADKPIFVELQAVGGFPKDYQDFFDSRNKCLATQIRSVFAQLLKRVALDPTTWTNEHIFFNGDVKHFEEFDRPVFTLKVRWVGHMYKDEEISLDIVPAVRKKGWWPSNTNCEKFLVAQEKIVQEGFLFLIQNPYFESDTLFRISCSPGEICLMNSLPSFVRQSYRLCKLLRHRSVCPKMDACAESDHFTMLQAEKIITSYHLKNCLFYTLRNLERDNLLSEVTEADERQIIVDIAVRILKYFDQCLLAESLPLYIIPDREDNFRFNYEELSHIQGRNLTILNNFRCTRRRAFLKIMLHVLGQHLAD